MAQFAVVSSDQLDEGFVLAPERYDPRRRKAPGDITIADVALIIRDQITPTRRQATGHYLVLDTGDAYEGTIRTNRAPVTLSEIGSAKKLTIPGDVIISRLRPYLRQVAYVDSDLCQPVQGQAQIACSTEFFVLRSRDARSLAFLVPLLLGDAIQEVLAAAQEGGHHPRFNQSTLERLPIPEAALATRDEDSATVESVIKSMRHASHLLQHLSKQWS